jgi:hypothetical protein
MLSRPFLIALAIGACMILSLSAGIASACSCAPPPPPKQALEQSAAVFSGKVTAIRQEGFTKHVTFEVTSAWKGAPGAKVTIQTAADGATCGYGFKVGDKFLVYCYQNPQDKRILATNICTRTKPLAEAAEDLKDLGPGEKPKTIARD